MQKLRLLFSGLSPIAVTALLSVLVLAGVSIVRVITIMRPPATPVVATAAAEAASSDPEVTADWVQELMLLGLIDASDAPAATSTDHLAMIGPMIMGEIYGSYSALKERGNYTKDDLQAAAARISESMKAAIAYEAFKTSDFTIDSDTSQKRVGAYRDELLVALAPISSIQEAEYVTLSRYVETKDPAYLSQLKDAARAYQAATERASIIIVPKDAVTYHRDVLNALRGFSAVLDGMTDHAEDPFASVALLRAYAEKEQGIKASYDQLRAYYANKAL